MAGEVRVLVREYGSAIEAEMAQRFLETAGIDATTPGVEGARLFAHFPATFALLVPSSQVAEARELLQELDNAPAEGAAIDDIEAEPQAGSGNARPLGQPRLVMRVGRVMITFYLLFILSFLALAVGALLVVFVADLVDPAPYGYALELPTSFGILALGSAVLLSFCRSLRAATALGAVMLVWLVSSAQPRSEPATNRFVPTGRSPW